MRKQRAILRDDADLAAMRRCGEAVIAELRPVEDDLAAVRRLETGNNAQ